jgi:tagaturonate epimerase
MTQTAPSPVVPLDLAPSFGFGDRLGLATPGHVTAIHQHGGPIQPIFAQQSIREMARTQRTPQQVMRDAISGAKSAGYTGKQGADADHLKTPEDVDRTAAAGFVFFTIDPSGEVDPRADDYSSDELAIRFRAVSDETSWVKDYQGKTIRLPTGTAFELSQQACAKAAVKYGRAIRHAVQLAGHIRSVTERLGMPHEIELSVDETPQPTTLAEHYIIADQCLQAGMKLVSLAPRFIGEFEKGVDYKGDLARFEKSLADHAAIAKTLGPYKLSLHSGSDKLSIYGIFARVSGGLFHVKTAGTSYLEALRVVAKHDPKLFAHMIDFSRSCYDTDKATYHVSATVAGVAAPAQVSDPATLEKLYLGIWRDVPPGRGLSDPGRQILHCTFGSVLTHPEFGPAVRDVVKNHPDTYHDVLAFHFGKHLDALRSGM